jgi:hypothetical protein
LACITHRPHSPSTGGAHSVENYLPAHSICNNYRWHYDAEEFQWILKLGVWLRTQIETEKQIGRVIGQKFCEHERRRAGRRFTTDAGEITVFDSTIKEFGVAELRTAFGSAAVTSNDHAEAR